MIYSEKKKKWKVLRMPAEESDLIYFNVRGN